MSDFVSQVQEVEQKLKAEWQTVQQDWKDRVAGSFDTGVMQPYMKNFQQYITGEGVTGYGIDQLMQQMEKHLRDMSPLTVG